MATGRSLRTTGTGGDGRSCLYPSVLSASVESSALAAFYGAGQAVVGSCSVKSALHHLLLLGASIGFQGKRTGLKYCFVKQSSEGWVQRIHFGED